MLTLDIEAIEMLKMLGQKGPRDESQISVELDMTALKVTYQLSILAQVRYVKKSKGLYAITKHGLEFLVNQDLV